MPRWLAPATTAIPAAGVAVSTYLTIAYPTSPDVLACSEKGLVNCAAVTTSAQSTFLGMPVAVLGLGWWLVMLALSLPFAWRASSPIVWRARLGLSVLGVGFVLWLVYAEFVIIGKVCLWCTVVHLLALAMFALVVLFGLEPSND